MSDPLSSSPTQLRGFTPEAALFDAALGLFAFRALGGRLAALLPSDLAYPVRCRAEPMQGGVSIFFWFSLSRSFEPVALKSASVRSVDRPSWPRARLR